jgi:hypothetical protein
VTLEELTSPPYALSRKGKQKTPHWRVAQAENPKSRVDELREPNRKKMPDAALTTVSERTAMINANHAPME